MRGSTLGLACTFPLPHVPKMQNSIRRLQAQRTPPRAFKRDLPISLKLKGFFGVTLAGVGAVNNQIAGGFTAGSQLFRLTEPPS